MGMKRGDIITIALSGDYGKPRPGLIIQSDLFLETGSVAVLPLTSHLIDAPLIRVLVEPSEDNGLTKTSHIMVDKLYTTPREKIGSILGHIDAKIMLEVERSLVVFVGIA
jgi:mRNA interferase MazF